MSLVHPYQLHVLKVQIHYCTAFVILVFDLVLSTDRELLNKAEENVIEVGASGFDLDQIMRDVGLHQALRTSYHFSSKCQDPGRTLMKD